MGVVKRAILLAAAGFSVWACRSAVPRGAVEGHLEFEGRTREFIEIPVESPRAILFVLHGGGGTAAHMIRLAEKLPELAKQQGIVLVYPQGIGKGWNDGRTEEISEATRERINDVGYLENLARMLMQKYSIGPDRVFAAGISNGGMMSQRLACDTDMFRTVVSVAANLQASYQDHCKPPGHRNILFILGTEDPLVPYQGGFIEVLGKKRGRVLSADETLAFWRAKNNCSSEPPSLRNIPDSSDDGTHADEQWWKCDGARIGLIRVHGGGHTWPGGLQYLPAAIVGKTSRDFSASERIVEFAGSLE